MKMKKMTMVNFVITFFVRKHLQMIMGSIITKKRLSKKDLQKNITKQLSEKLEFADDIVFSLDTPAKVYCTSERLILN